MKPKEVVMPMPVIGVLTAALFVSASAATAGAQSPPTEESAARTVEIPGAGASVTLPRQWRTWVAESDGQPISVWTTDLASGWMCRIASDEIASEQDLVSAEAAADAVTEGAEYGPPFEFDVAEPFEIPTGSAVLVTFGSSERDPWYRIERIVLVDAPQGVVRVSCGSAPADHVSDVARTIAPLASDYVPEPFDPRVEFAGHGFAVDFGQEWQVSSRLALLGAQGTLLGGTPVLSASRRLSLQEGPTDRCSIEDDSDVPRLTGLGSVGDWRAAIKDAGKGTLHAKTPAMKIIDLASGPALRADWPTRPAQTTAWIVSDAEHVLVLRCSSERPPNDRWRSIAETIEFLPAEA
jgi:hypothetical protein